VTTPEQDATVDAIRQHHGVATVGRQQDGTVKVIVPQDRAFTVMLDGDAVDLETKRTIPREEIQEHGC
jgi:hypothetical protein